MLFSSVLDNVPQVGLFTTLIKDFCWKTGAAPSPYLLPMNYASMIGNFALTSTSNNLIIAGLMQERKLRALHFFEMATATGIPAILCILYLVFISRYILPKNKGGMFLLVQEQGNKFLMQLQIKPGIYAHRDIN